MTARLTITAALLAIGCGRDPQPPPEVLRAKACHRAMTQRPPPAGDPAFDCVVPILRVDDLTESVRYYVQRLGFAKDWDWGEPPTFASVSRGNVAIFMCERCQGQPQTWLSVFVSDVDRLHAQYRDRGATISRPPRDESWGGREMLVTDPDGHTIRFSGPIDP